MKHTLNQCFILEFGFGRRESTTYVSLKLHMINGGCGSLFPRTILFLILILLSWTSILMPLCTECCQGECKK